MRHRTKLLSHLYFQFGRHCSPERSALDVARILEAQGLIKRDGFRYQETDAMRGVQQFPDDVLKLLNEGEL